jgi:hypothetical protein
MPYKKDIGKSSLTVHTSPIPPCKTLISQPHDWFQALDEIYHPIWAAVPNSPTLRKAAACWHDAEVAYGTLALYVAPFSEGLYPRRHARDHRS